MKKNTRNLLLVLGLVVILGAAVLVLAPYRWAGGG